MKGKNWVVSLLAVGMVLPFPEVLLVNIKLPSASNFEAEMETLISSNKKKEEPCESEGGKIVCPP